MASGKLQNHMEFMVEEALQGWVKSGEKFCDCQKCRLDIMAYALNRLPAKYVVTREGEVHTQLESLHLQFKTDVMSQVLEALQKIAQNPRH